MAKPVKIGLTACGNYHFYYGWFVHEPGVEIIELDARKDNFSDVDICDGVVLTGGQDIHPRYYHKTLADIPNATAIDEERDAFEWKLLEHIQQQKTPLLGICRGLQLANVFHGGSLITDIPTAGKNNHSKFGEGRDRYHPIVLSEDSRLKKIVGLAAGEINSAHHQGVAALGEGLRAAAFSDDGIIEALEPLVTAGSPYLLLVQWHPERMNDPSSPFSAAIKKDFLHAVREAVQ